MPLPTLTTARLRLLPAGTPDLDFLWTLWSDPQVRRYLFDDQPMSQQQASDTLASCLAVVQQGLGLWIARSRLTSQPLGCVALLPTSVAATYEPSLKGRIEPVASFLPAAWGYGFAREALAAAISYALGTPNMPPLCAINDLPNEASDRMLRAVGFRVVRDCQGPAHPLRIYELDRPTEDDPR